MCQLSQSSMTPNLPHQTPRVHLLDTTFRKLLPMRYSKIIKNWNKTARLYREVSSELMATDRAAKTDSLQVGIELLEHDISEYRRIVNGIELEDIVHLYTSGGRQRCEAEEMAREDYEDLERSLSIVEKRTRVVKARIVNGFASEE
jgi:hypothetical protein